MTTTKAWYLSRTVWASVVTIMIAVIGLLGLPIEAVDEAGLVDALLQGATAIAGLIALIGRLGASTKIG